jgi:hypothetical protein
VLCVEPPPLVELPVLLPLLPHAATATAMAQSATANAAARVNLNSLPIPSLLLVDDTTRQPVPS